jgi:hypothetical protein
MDVRGGRDRRKRKVDPEKRKRRREKAREKYIQGLKDQGVYDADLDRRDSRSACSSLDLLVGQGSTTPSRCRTRSGGSPRARDRTTGEVRSRPLTVRQAPRLGMTLDVVSSSGRKARQRFVGAQGSGDGAQKDTAKLDVASRVAEAKKKAEEGGGRALEDKKVSDISIMVSWALWRLSQWRVARGSLCCLDPAGGRGGSEACAYAAFLCGGLWRLLGVSGTGTPETVVSRAAVTACRRR